MGHIEVSGPNITFLFLSLPSVELILVLGNVEGITPLSLVFISSKNKNNNHPHLKDAAYHSE